MHTMHAKRKSAWRTLLAVLLLAVSGAATAGAQTPIQLQNVKFDVLSARAAGTAQITATPFDIGSINEVFDGSENTLARTASINPAFVQVAWSGAHALRRFRVRLSHATSHDWSIETADTTTDLANRTGTYRLLLPPRNFPSDTWDEFDIGSPVSAKIVRLNVKRYGGDNYVHIDEWEIYGDATMDSLSVSPSTATLNAGDAQQFRATGRDSSSGETFDVVNSATWSVTGGIGTVTSGGLFTAQQGGTGGVAASVGTLSGSAPVTVRGGNVDFDIDVLRIERTPRIAFDPNDLTLASGQPAIGQPMTYLAHVKNWGASAATVPFSWSFDGSARTGSVAIGAGQEVTVPYLRNWDGKAHTLTFKVTPAATPTEVSKLNNSVSVKTNAILVGLWVEQSLYNHFHARQRELGTGSNSFEDWGQNMMAHWNAMFAGAIFPGSPRGVLDRVALDKVTVVPNDALPLRGGPYPTNDPDANDLTVDLQWGYEYRPQDVQPGGNWDVSSRSFKLELESIHEMNHARYLTDNYAFDINHHANEPHVFLTDDNNQLVAGTPYMPRIRYDVLYYNKYPDIMSDAGTGEFYNAYNAVVWNLKAFKRGRGNRNAPPDFEDFMQSLPERNHIQLLDQTGQLMVGAQVSVYRSVRGNNSEGEQVFDNTPDFSTVVDSRGYANLPRNPFSDGRVSAYENGTLILKVRFRGQLYFLFQEVTDFNLAFWRGQKTDAYYTRRIDLRDNTNVVPKDAWLGSYFNGTKFQTRVLSRRETALQFDWGAGSPATGVNVDGFTAQWVGDLRLPTGYTTFTIEADGGAQLYIDNRLVFDQINNSTSRIWKPVIYVPSDAPIANPGTGEVDTTRHRIEVRYRHSSGNAKLKFSF